MLRIDKAIRPPGLIRSSKTYSLFFDTDRVYGIAVGRASMKVGSVPMFGGASSFAGKVLTPTIERAIDHAYAPKIAAGEAGIDVNKLPELATQKYNFNIPYSSITELIVATDYIQGPYIKIKFGSEKLKLIFRDKTKAEVEALAQNFHHEIIVKK